MARYPLEISLDASLYDLLLNIKCTSKMDKKIDVVDFLTDRQADVLTDIFISRAAFAAEKGD